MLPRTIIITVVLIGILSIGFNDASAMSGVDFMNLKPATSIHQVLEPIVIHFVSQGYKNVPDWAELAVLIRTLILKEGIGHWHIDDLALKAAKQNGMRQ